MSSMGQQFLEILKRMEEEEKTRQDFTLPLSSLRMREDGIIVNPTFGEMPLGESAMAQLCGNLRLPTDYMRRLMKERPDMVAQQVNYFLNQSADNPNESRMIRMKNGRIQGIVGEGYVPFDNVDVLHLFSDVANEFPTADVKLSHISDRTMNLRLVFPELLKDFGYDRNGDKDNLFIGFDLRNSEISASSVQIQPVIWRLVCSNGMRRILAKGEMLRQRHIHFDPQELRKHMVVAIQSSIENGKEALDRLQRARQVKVMDVNKKIEEIGKQAQLTKKRIEVIQNNFQYDPEKSMYGIVNALTRTGRDLKSAESRFEMEELAGRILLTA